MGEVNEKQLKDQRYNGVELGDRVGQAGIEAEYDRFLRGRNGAARVEVDALGNLTKTLKQVDTQQGSQLRLSLDLGVQEAAQQALAGGHRQGRVRRDGREQRRGARARLPAVVTTRTSSPSR